MFTLLYGKRPIIFFNLACVSQAYGHNSDVYNESLITNNVLRNLF